MSSGLWDRVAMALSLSLSHPTLLLDYFLKSFIHLLAELCLAVTLWVTLMEKRKLGLHWAPFRAMPGLPSLFPQRHWSAVLYHLSEVLHHSSLVSEDTLLSLGLS